VIPTFKMAAILGPQSGVSSSGMFGGGRFMVYKRSY
jgi:hypothetical protein